MDFKYVIISIYNSYSSMNKRLNIIVYSNCFTYGRFFVAANIVWLYLFNVGKENDAWHPGCSGWLELLRLMRRWKWALQFAEDTFSDFRCYEQGATVTWWGTKKLARNLKRIVNKILQKNMFSFDFDFWKSKAKCWKNLNTKLRVRIKILCWQFFSYLHLAGLETTLSHNLNSNFCWEV